MKILLKNDFKVRKKFILAYFIFIAMIFAIKSLGLYTKELYFFAEKPFAVFFLVAILIHYILYLISSEGMILDKSKPYLLCLGASRRDVINIKFLKILTIFLIDAILMAYVIHNIEMNGMEFRIGFFLILYVMAYYLLSIPIFLYFGQNSGVGSTMLASPALIPIFDKFGANPAGFFVGMIKGTSSFKLILILFIFVAIIYIISKIIVENKDF